MASEVFANPEFTKLARDNADPANWTWKDFERGAWKKNHGVWQKFADKWRHFNFDRGDPSGLKIDLALPALSGDDCLIVRSCYVEAEKLVWKQALSLPQTGVIIMGQPGIGKTLFLWYLLLRLLSMRQVVLVHVSGLDVLFYHDGVYRPSRDANVSDLPSPGAGSFIWSLFDLYPNEMVPPFAVDPQCFPVQGPSPNPSLYRNWRKVRGPRYTVFPLWTLEELNHAARSSGHFKVFSTHFENMIDNWRNPNFLSTNPGIVEFLKELFPREEWPESFEQAFDILLNGLVSRFGAIPRQIFRAMFENFEQVAEDHDSALHTSFEKLQEVADALIRGDPFADMQGPSHRVISINNVGTLESKELQIEFLSPVIAKKFSKRLWEESQVKARSMIKHFLEMPQTRGLAGSMFEPFAHRCIANPDEAGGTWALRLMSSDNGSNTFGLRDQSETVPGFPKIERQLVSFHIRDLGLASLHHDMYYTPTIINHPLFDSFVVDLPPFPDVQCLWLLQMTTSDLHKGSKKGYPVANEITKKIQNQREPLQPPPAKKRKGKEKEPLPVQVNYVLVRPAGQKDHKWVLSEGWEDELNVYLLELPLENDIDEPQKSDKASKPGSEQPPKEATKRSVRLKDIFRGRSGTK